MATIQKKFLIDSRDRLTGTSENFTISLNGSYKIISFSLLELTITKAWYAITTSNNYIDFTEDGADPTEASFSISEGNYSSSQLETALKAAFDLASKNGRTYTIDTDQTNGRITITGSAGNFNLLFETGTHTATSICTIIGFNATDTGNAGAHTSVKFISLTDEDYFFIKSDTLCSTRNGFISSSGDDHIIGVIPSGSNGDIYTYCPNITIPRMVVNPDRALMETCDFYLTRRNNVTLGLNGAEWYMICDFTVLLP